MSDEALWITCLLALSEGHEIRMFGDLYIRQYENGTYGVGRSEQALDGVSEQEVLFLPLKDAVQFFLDQRAALRLGYSYERVRGQ